MIVYFYSTLDVEYGYRPRQVIMSTSDEEKGLFTVAWYGTKQTTVEDIKKCDPSVRRLIQQTKKRKLDERSSCSQPKRSRQLVTSALVNFGWNGLSASKANVEFIEAQLEILKQRLTQAQSVD